MENFALAGSSINSRCWKVCCWEQSRAAGCSPPAACRPWCSSLMPFLQFLGRPYPQTFSLTFSGRAAPWVWKALCCHRVLSATPAYECLCQDNILCCVPVKLQFCVLLKSLCLLTPSQMGSRTSHSPSTPTCSTAVISTSSHFKISGDFLV